MSFKKDFLFPCNPPTARGASTKLTANGNKIVYTNGKTVIIRDITNPKSSIAYSEHIAPATVAAISPSGYYCVSADQSGTVRVWDIAGTDQVLKIEVKAFAGQIKDLAWDGESKRIIAVGDGKERFGHVFSIDTGSSAGEISGHSKIINAISIRHQRPFRAASASDDTTIVFYHGAPYKYEKIIKAHKKFVQDVKFAPDGETFVSVGSDTSVFLFDGKTGEEKHALSDAHSGSIMAASWSPDSSHFITSSADRTVKLWDAATAKSVRTWTVGGGVDSQQVGNAWAGPEGIVSLSMNGELSLFDRRASEKEGPTQILYGAQRGVTAATTAPGKEPGTLFAGSYEGRVLLYDTSSGEVSPLKGTGHSAQVVSLTTDSQKVYASSFEDCQREIDATTATYSSRTTSLGAQPKAAATSGSSTIVCTTAGVVVIEDGKKKTELKTKFDALSVDVTANGLVAVGGGDNVVYLYELGSELQERGILTSGRGPITAVAFSPDGSKVVAGDSAGKIVLYDVHEKKMITGRWTFHSGRINSLAWAADGRHIASGSLDTHVYIWDTERIMKNIPLKNISPGGVSAVNWVGDSTDAKQASLSIAGADGCIRLVTVTYHA